MKLLPKVLLIFTLLRSSAFADELLDLASYIPIQLQNTGISDVGAYSMSKLFAEFQTVHTEKLINYPADNTGMRFGMVNYPGVVQYWPPSVKYPSPAVAQVWLTHEFLGANGHYDHKYENSIALWWLLQLNKDKRDLFLKNVLLIQMADGGGGVTGTGGGGDPWAIATKMLLMKIAEDYWQKNCKEEISIYQLYQRILKLPLETNNDTNQEEITESIDRFGNQVILIPIAYGIASSNGILLSPFIKILDRFVRGDQ